MNCPVEAITAHAKPTPKADFGGEVRAPAMQHFHAKVCTSSTVSTSAIEWAIVFSQIVRATARRAGTGGCAEAGTGSLSIGPNEMAGHIIGIGFRNEPQGGGLLAGERGH